MKLLQSLMARKRRFTRQQPPCTRSYARRTGTLLACCWLCLAGSSSAQPANDNFTNRLQLTGTNITNVVSNTGATAEPGEPSHNGTNPAVSSIWFTWTAPAPGGVEITAATPPSSVFDFPIPILAVYTCTNLSTLTHLSYN